MPANLWLNRNYVLLLCAFTIAAFGDRVAEMAMLGAAGYAERPQVEHLQITAAMTFFYFLPYVLLGPINGLLADRLPRRTLMVSADVFRAVVLIVAPLLWLGWPMTPDPHLHPLALGSLYLLVGLGAAVFSPARGALLPTLIRQNQVVPANAMMGGLGIVFGGIGFSVGGWLAEAALGIGFILTVFTFLGSAALLTQMKLSRLTPVDHIPVERPKTTIRDGVVYVLTHGRVLEAMLLSATFWGLAGLVMSGIPVGLNEKQVGIVLGVFSFGMLFGAMFIAVAGNALREAWTITYNLLGMGALFALYGIIRFVFPPGPDERLAGQIVRHTLEFFVGFWAVGLRISADALTQRLTPDWIRGRVFGVYDVVSMATLLLVTGGLYLLASSGSAGVEAAGAVVSALFIAAGVLIVALGVLTFIVRYHRSSMKTWLTFYWQHFFAFTTQWWHRAKAVGRPTVPPTGPCIVVANHTASLDPLLVQGFLPHRVISWMVAREFYESPVTGFFCKIVDCVPVNRTGQDTASFKAALRALKEGKALGVFPQGRIEQPGETLPPREGPAVLALKAGVPVIPVHISGTTYSRWWFNMMWRRSRARVAFGEPIDVAKDYAGRERDKDAPTELMARIWSEVNKLAPRPDNEDPRPDTEPRP